MQVALHTVLRPGHEEDYDEVHRQVPPRLAQRLREVGVRDWRIWRDGRHVFHLVEVTDYHAMRRALRDDPENQAWQATVGPLFDEPDSYVGDDSGLSTVWALTDQLDAEE